MKVTRCFMQVGLLVLLTTGVLTAQLCLLVCGEMDNPNVSVASGTPAQSTKPTQHCHEPSPVPDPQPASHSCVSHDIVMEQTAATSLLGALRHFDGLSVALLPIRIPLAVTRQSVEWFRSSSLRAPPRTPQRQILRI